MKTKLLYFILFTFLVMTSFRASVISPQLSVYLCNSTGGKKYHYNKSCRGLSSCQHEIIKVTLQEAQKRGKTLCGYED